MVDRSNMHNVHVMMHFNIRVCVRLFLYKRCLDFFSTYFFFLSTYLLLPHLTFGIIWLGTDIHTFFIQRKHVNFCVEKIWWLLYMGFCICLQTHTYVLIISLSEKRQGHHHTWETKELENLCDNKKKKWNFLILLS